MRNIEAEIAARKARREAARQKELAAERAAAAVRIQKLQRAKTAREHARQMRQQREEQRKAKRIFDGAAKFQACWRGWVQRRKYAAQKAQLRAEERRRW